MEKINSPELLQEIFSHLTVADLKNVRLVSKQWREVSFLPSLNDKVVVTLSEKDFRGRIVSQMIASGFCISNFKFIKQSQMGSFSARFWSFYGASVKTLCLDSLSFELHSNCNRILDSCPNLEALFLKNCHGMMSGFLQLRKKSDRGVLKELLVESCDSFYNSIADLVLVLGTALTKLVYRPIDLYADQLTPVLKVIAKTLTDIDFEWTANRGSRWDLDFNAIFSVPSLKLQKVTLRCDEHFEDIIDALVTHHQNSLREISLVDNYSDVELELEKYFSHDLRNLRKFKCVGVLDKTSKLHAFSMLNELLVNSHDSLRDIELVGLVHLTRKADTDIFVPLVLLAEFGGPSFVAPEQEVVALYLVEQRLHLITRLKLRNIDLSKQGMANAIFANCTRLVELSLRKCNLSDDLLLNGAIRSRQVASLRNVRISNDVFPIMNLASLEVLCLSENLRLTWFGVTSAIKFARLKSLDLSANPSFCDIKFKLLALNNPRLEDVSFCDINLTESSITEFVRNALKLVKLDIRCNGLLTNAALHQLAKHKKLRKLNVQGCPLITGESISSVVSKYPSLDIVHESISI